MKRNSRLNIIFYTIAITLLLITDNANAYIGPGAGFAIITSFLAVFISFIIAIISIITLPVRILIRIIRKKRFLWNSKVEKVIVLGFDGLDPELVEKYISENKLPNFEKLKNSGTFKKLKTTTPAISPVAWSSFSTGSNPGKHNIYDFLKRSKESYLPELSSVYIGGIKKYLKLKKHIIPLGKPEIISYKKSKTFWKILGENGIFSTVLHVPVTFPVERFFGVQLAGMCVPDLKGTQGTFSFYTSNKNFTDAYSGGEITYVEVKNNKIETYIKGPKNPFRNDDSILKIPLKIFLKSKDELTVEVGNQTIALKKGEFTEWIRLKFNTSFGIKLRCICKFFLKSVEPYFELYITPLNIDPEKPALPVSHPFIYSSYLSKILGDYSTLGISDDTWALNERVIDEDAFLKLAYDNHSDKEKIFFNSLNKIKKGLIVNVFDISDTVQHMFFRYIGKKRNPEDIIEFEKYQNEIEKVYVKLDSIVEKVINQINDRTVLIIVSDHGFKSFRKGVNINSWLFANGYLHLKNGVKNSEKYFRNVDWAKTKAYALGLGGLYINQKGRESQGIVTRLDEKEKLKKEITEKLLDLKDEETGEKVIKNIYDADEVYRGPYKNEAPDLLIGYSEGYRASWDSVIGKITDKIIEVNEKSWSGDHCIDPEIVPGVFFCNRKINTDNPEIIDIAPTVLNLFGITPPHYMDGKNLI